MASEDDTRRCIAGTGDGLRLMSDPQRAALVIGSTCGIGLASALRLARSGYREGFHARDDPAAEDWVAVQALAVLARWARQVTESLTAQAGSTGGGKPADRRGGMRALPGEQ